MDPLTKTLDERVASKLKNPDDRSNMQDTLSLFEKIKSVLGEAELKTALEMEYGMLSEKKNVWTTPQEMMLFVGKDAATVEQARKANRNRWMDVAAEWFDLEIDWMMKEY